METYTCESGAISSAKSGWLLTLAPDIARPEQATALRELVALAQSHGGGRLEFWRESYTPDDDEAPTTAGLVAYRELLIMRVDLPIDAEIVDTRPFVDSDADEFLRVNNRAFWWHPEQSGMTHDDLAARQSEPWYDPAGFRILERDGRMAGFCWTKVHTDTTPHEGEIFVIGVDPDFHGQGLGMPLTAAGLRWLSDTGLTVGILYVESDNHAAVRTYEKLGFSRWRINRAYELEVPPQ